MPWTSRDSTLRLIGRHQLPQGVEALATTGCATRATRPPTMFEGFNHAMIKAEDVAINTVYAGQGPPVLLLHGWPQTHVAWHKIAPQLAREFTVVATDGRGYGDSSKPRSDSTHAAYSKRVMAKDQVAVMAQLGFRQFAVVGHDRGGRVAHRMALDHPARITKLAVLDIAPTLTVYESMNAKVAQKYWHWLFLNLPPSVPETMLENSATLFMEGFFALEPPGTFTEEAKAEYRRFFSDPDSLRAGCEDFRASASIDLEQDRADRDRKVECPVLALWASKGNVKGFFDPLGVWRDFAADLQGREVAGTHSMAEANPADTLAALQRFLG
jgi:haloacetate dehalogenase